MPEIVLLILKIAGIIIAAILGILIVTVCLVLFVPVRYRGVFSVADAAQGDGKDVGVFIRAAWFLRLVRVYVSVEETARVRVKVLFFTLMDTAKEKAAGEKEGSDKRKKEGDKKAESTAEKEQEEAAVKKQGEVSVEEKAANISECAGQIGDAINNKEKKGNHEDSGAEKNKVEKSGDRENETEEKAGQETSAQKEKKSIKSRIDNILQTIRTFCDKLKRAKEKAAQIKELWDSDHMINSRSLLGKQLAYLLKHTKPKKLEGYLRFGFEDPAATGYAMAVYGILYPIWSPKLSVEPDFEKEMLDCRVLLKGKIRVWHFVRAVLRMILSGDVRRVIKDIKKLY